MITLNIDAQLIRAAQANQAKKDPRYYLKGILLTTTGEVVGTDGHTLFQGRHDWEDCDTLPCDVIIGIDGTIPVTANTVTFEFPDFESGDTGMTGTARTDNGKLYAFSVIDGKFPDWKRVIPDRLSSTGTYSNAVTVNGDLLARIAKTFGKNPLVNIYHRHHSESMRVECAKMPDCVMVIMPGRTESQPDFISLTGAKTDKKEA